MGNYSTEEDVYFYTGMNQTVIENLSDLQKGEITKMIEGFIQDADDEINRELKVPYKVRKEDHEFNKNQTVELGPEEDRYEFFGEYDPSDCVENVWALYRDGRRVKLPYPKDCDEFTEEATDWTGSNVTISEENTIFKCGTASIKAIFSDSGYIRYPSNLNLNKRVYPWDYIGFWARTTDKTVTFTLRLYDVDGNYEEEDFSLTLDDTWELVQIDLSDLNESGIDWTDTYCQYFEIRADGACTLYVDNFNFNDGFFWTYPEGLICWSDPDTDPYGWVQVTYEYNPYVKKDTFAKTLKKASAKLAGVELLNYLIGCRQRITAFEAMSEDFEPAPDKETLVYTRNRLRTEAYAALAALGFGGTSGMG